MKIAVVALRFPTLSETFVLNHVTGLLDAGHQVQVFSLYRSDDEKVHPDVSRYHLPSRTEYLGVPRIRNRLASLPGTLFRAPVGDSLYGLNPFRHGMGTASLVPLFSASHFRRSVQQRFDIVHCHFGTVGYALIHLRELFHAPFVTSFHGFDLTAFRRWGPLIYRRLFRSGDAFVANSGYTADRLRRMGCSDDKIHRIPAIFDDRAETARAPVLTSETTELLTVARLVEEKGVEHGLRTVQILARDGHRVRYTIVGDGALRARLERLALELGIRHMVHFTGWLTREEVYGHYRRADVFLLPSVEGPGGAEEAQGLVLQEAQLHEVPIVASRIGGIPEGLNGGEAGLLVEPGNPAEIAAAVCRLREDPALAKSLARAGRDHCIANHSRESIISRLVGLYRSLSSRATTGSVQGVVDRSRSSTGEYQWTFRSSPPYGGPASSG